MKPVKIPSWILHLGSLGVFGVALVDASPVPVPIPGGVDLLILIFAANRANPFGLTAAAVLGSAIGAYLTWATGEKGGEELLDRRISKRIRSRVHRWSKKYGAFSVFLAGLAPPPLPTRPFLLAAGAGGTRAQSALPAFAISRLLRFGLEVYLGRRYGSQMLDLWSKYESSGVAHALLWALAGVIVCGVALGGWEWMRVRRRERSS